MAQTLSSRSTFYLVEMLRSQSLFANLTHMNDWATSTICKLFATRTSLNALKSISISPKTFTAWGQVDAGRYYGEKE